jgi:REP element-mobilizing transposase RayT
LPQTLALNLVHLIFSTKGRVPSIRDEILADLSAYLACTARRLGCDCFRVGGVQDHVHLALRLASTRTAAKVVSELKTSSSVWMKEQGVAAFAWQRGYGLFSVSPADLDALVRYIDGQKAHHAKRDFQEEMRAFCKRYGVALHEQYAWD